ncbi:MAG: hypothetical protein ACREQ4_12880 [Candidatus Binataceae bacterium]
MRRIAQFALAVWFAIVTGMVQACAGPASSADSVNYGTSTASASGSFTPGTYPSYPSAGPRHGGSPPASAGSSPASISYPPAVTPDDSTARFTKNASESEALTNYLKHHRLPLVGAEVMNGPNGKRKVMLYGFVATDFGKADAVTKTHRFLHDSNIAVDNRVNVRPELLASGSSSSNTNSPSAANSGSSSPSSSYPGVRGYMQQQPQDRALAQRQYGSGSTLSMVLPLIALIAVLGAGMATSGGAGGFGGTMGPPGLSPYRGYNPFPTYPSSSYPGYSLSPPYSGYPSAPPYTGFPGTSSGFPPYP